MVIIETTSVNNFKRNLRLKLSPYRRLVFDQRHLEPMFSSIVGFSTFEFKYYEN